MLETAENIEPNNQNTHPNQPGEVLVRVENLSKKFCRDFKKSLWYGFKDSTSAVIGRQQSASNESPVELRKGEFWANKDISFELRRGECLGLIGRNGAGKTTLLKMLNGLIKPDQGRIEMKGRIGSLIALGAGFNPLLTGRENIYINGSVLGLSKKEIDQIFDEIVAFAEIEEFIDAPVRTYSSGMQVRLGFAVASALEPDILLLDEVLAVGDARFRAKCQVKIRKVLSKAAVIFVSHDAMSVRRTCDKGLLLEQGRPLGLGGIKTILDRYESDCAELGKPDEMLLMDEDYLEQVDVSAEKSRLDNGGELSIQYSVKLKRETCIAKTILGFNTNGDIAAQTEVLVGHKAKGLFEYTINVKPIHLRSGSYSLNTAVYNKENHLLFRFESFDTVTVNEGVNGVAYNIIPSKVEFSSSLAE